MVLHRFWSLLVHSHIRTDVSPDILFSCFKAGKGNLILLLWQRCIEPKSILLGLLGDSVLWCQEPRHRQDHSGLNVELPATVSSNMAGRGGKKCRESHGTTDGGFSRKHRKPRLISAGFIFDVRKRSEGIPWTPHMNHGETWWNNMVSWCFLYFFPWSNPSKDVIFGAELCRPPGIIVFFSSRGRQIVAAWKKNT